MFILTTISDLVRIIPEDFAKRHIEVITDNLNEKYSNKVIQKIGLGICVYDVLEASDGQISHGDGIANVNVKFRLVVFRPFKGEIILGKISSAGQWGMKSMGVRLDFFDDILVPPHLLFENSRFDHQEQCWIWNNDGSDYFFDKHEWVRIRVEQEHWHDNSPVAPSRREEASTLERKSPYSITASMEQAGLGIIDWW